MRRIVIIGGGFCGALLSVHLLRAAGAHRPIHITLIEREPRRVARGYAYSAGHDACLLNVPAGRMSAFEDDVDHFVRWAHQRDASINGGSFVPRRLFGDYIASLLGDAGRDSSPHATLETIAAEAAALDDDEVRLRDGRPIRYDQVVLALGNLPPSAPRGLEGLGDGGQYTPNPWAPAALDAVPLQGPVLLIGTGLTMLDIALVLQDRGHAAPIHTISRRGLVPQAHRVSREAPPVLPLPTSLRVADPTPGNYLRALRAEIESCRQRGIDWREVVTSLRRDTPQLWQALDERGRRQFLRHLQPFWETHRHRAAPETARRIGKMRAAGQLIVTAARIKDFEPSAGEVVVTLRPRGAAGDEQLRIAHVINCTGPDTNLRRSGGELLRDAIDRGLLVADELALGLMTAPDGAVIDSHGVKSDRVFTLGSLRKPQLWETTAVPELRIQARDLAERLLS